LHDSNDSKICFLEIALRQIHSKKSTDATDTTVSFAP